MGTIVRTLVLLLLLQSSAFAQPMIGRVLFDSGAFVCNGQTLIRYWWNKEERMVKVYKVGLWLGMSYKGIADFGTGVRRLSDEGVLAIVGWDHYMDPVAPSNWTENFAPNWIEIAPGDGIYLYSNCSSGLASGHPNAHVVVTIWRSY